MLRFVVVLLIRLTQLLAEASVFMSWRAAYSGEAIPQTVGETAEAASDCLAVT